jgi:hypothetical protein
LTLELRSFIIVRLRGRNTTMDCANQQRTTAFNAVWGKRFAVYGGAG